MKNLLIALAVLAVLPASAQGNNPHGHTAPPAAPAADDTAPPQGWLGAGAAIPAELTQIQQVAKPYCPSIEAKSTTDETQGYFTCDCAVDHITQQSWNDYDSTYSGHFMTTEDAELIRDAVRDSPDMATASTSIYYGLSPDGESVLSSCFSK